MLDNYCNICADPLEWTAYGVCGHKETCSTCAVRMRSMMKEKRCALCRQEQPCVFVTRFAGDYTVQLPPDAFENNNLKEKAASGELNYLDTAQAYFDDPQHYSYIKSLCSITHPRALQDGKPKTFNSLRALKAHLLNNQKLHFCDICLEGRKVFLPEQQVYTAKSLDRHMRQGDEEGPMASTSFAGHPECKFCKKRFYGESELFTHMTSSHEECHLCKRANQNRHVYYRDYADLENHYEQQHFPCKNPYCLEQKFVVFTTEQELKQHTAREHGAGMSRAEKKAALSIPINVNYRRDGASTSRGPSRIDPGSAPAVPLPRSGITIGGGAGATASRFGGQGQRGSRPDLVAIEQQQAAALAQAEQGVGSIELGPINDVEFPSVSASSSGMGPAIGGRWAGAAGAGSALTTEDFPALPGTSKGARRRAAAKAKKSTADIVGRGGTGEVRVVRTGPGNSAEDFPSLPGGSSNTGFDGYRQLSRDDQDEWVAVRTTNSGNTGRGVGVQTSNSGQLRRPPSAQEVIEPPQSASDAQFPTLAASAAIRPGGTAGPTARKEAVTPKTSIASGPPVASGTTSEALRAANKALIEKIRARLNSEQAFGHFKQCSADWVRGRISSQSYHDTIVGLGLASVVPDLAATCPDDNKRLELLTVHSRAFSDSPDEKQTAPGSWVPPEAAAAAADYASRHSSWACGLCTLVNAPNAVTCEACGHRKGVNLAALPSTGGASEPTRRQQERLPPAARQPAMPLPQARAGTTSWSAVGASVPAAPAAQFVPAASVVSRPPPSLESDFPALEVSERGASDGVWLVDTAASSTGGQQQNGGSGESSQKGGGGKNKKKKQPLNEFMKSTKTHTQNVWKNQNLRGQWSRAGELAQEERALNDAWAKQ